MPPERRGAVSFRGCQEGLLIKFAPVLGKFEKDQRSRSSLWFAYHQKMRIILGLGTLIIFIWAHQEQNRAKNITAKEPAVCCYLSLEREMFAHSVVCTMLIFSWAHNNKLFCFVLFHHSTELPCLILVFCELFLLSGENHSQDLRASSELVKLEGENTIHI